MALIGLGLAMLMQPWSLDIYSYSFAVLLAGVAGYTDRRKAALTWPRSASRTCTSASAISSPCATPR